MRLLLASALLLAAPGCHLVFSHAPSRGETRAADAGARDARLDLARPEDASHSEAARRDLPRDTPVAPVDARPIDQARPEDITIPKPDLVPTVACSTVTLNGDLPKVVVDSKGKPIVIASGGHVLFGCEYPTGPITQCDAAKVCKAPWKLCTPSAYASALPSAATPDGLEWGWLAGCVRKAGTAGLFQTTCGICDATTDTVKAPLMVDCSKPIPAPFPSGVYADAGVPLAKNVGLMSYYQNWCWFPPGSAGAAAGVWAPCPVDGKKGVGGGNKTALDPRRALCCWP